MKKAKWRVAVQSHGDRAYIRTANRLGATMLVFLALFTGLHILADALYDALLTDTSAMADDVIIGLGDGLAYLLSFMLPVLFLRRITPPAERESMMLSPRLPRRLWAVLLAGMAVI